MRRVFLIAMAGIGLTGCASMDAFKSAPTPIAVQIDSVPQSANASTSGGQSCVTPCTLQIAAEKPFTVTFTLDKHQEATVEVNVVKTPGDFTTPTTTVIDPNPIVAELAPVAPPAKKRRAPAKRAAAPSPATTATIVAPEPSGSVFPDPTRR